MIDKELIYAKVKSRLKDYVGIPITKAVRDSIYAECIDEIKTEVEKDRRGSMAYGIRGQSVISRCILRFMRKDKNQEKIKNCKEHKERNEP